MATVTKEFKSAFDKWSAAKIRSGEFTPESMADLRELIRKDLKPGPDTVRAELGEMKSEAGRKLIPIDDVNERMKLWEDMFNEECR